MLFLQRLSNIIIFIVFTNTAYRAQSAICYFHPDSTDCYLVNNISNKYFPIQTQYQSAIKIALLYYPELARVKITFRSKNTITPLSARPSLLSLFRKPSKRKYIITISQRSTPKLDPIIFKNLTFNSQIGVIGHELAHNADFNKMKLKHFIKLAFKHFNKRSMDSFEFNTDKSCIEHGLGHQLLSWSEEVRIKLNILKWGGANNPIGVHERYMDPATIISYYNSLLIYNK